MAGCFELLLSQLPPRSRSSDRESPVSGYSFGREDLAEQHCLDDSLPCERLESLADHNATSGYGLRWIHVETVPDAREKSWDPPWVCLEASSSSLSLLAVLWAHRAAWSMCCRLNGGSGGTRASLVQGRSSSVTRGESEILRVEIKIRGTTS